ncbi:cops3, partial [Symbiodinium pilosum]
MDSIVHQIHTLSTQNESDLKKLKDFLRTEQETLKANAPQIDQALQALDPVQCTLGVAYLLQAQLSAAAYSNQLATFAFICNFLRVADGLQAKKAASPMTAVCRSFSQMAIDLGQQAMLKSLKPLRSALGKLQDTPETLTPVHSEFLRVCLKVKVYHLAAQLLDQPIFDISASNSTGNSSPAQVTAQSFLSYFYYGALVRIGMRDFPKALQLLLVVLTCPASCLSAIQADAYKKYVLLCLKVHGEVKLLPIYTSHILVRYSKSPSYVLDIAEAFKAADLAAMQRIIEEKQPAIEVDQNMGLAKQVLASMRRHKIRTLTKTYLTLSLAEIATEAGLGDHVEAEAVLFDMISEGEIQARIDQRTGNVSFEDAENLDTDMMQTLQVKLGQIMELSQRISGFEQEVVTSESYVRKTSLLDMSGSA